MGGRGGQDGRPPRADGEVRVACRLQTRKDWYDTCGDVQKMLGLPPPNELVLASLIRLWRQAGPEARKKAVVVTPEIGFQPG